ncbi:MAG: hypothetical protein Q8Q01_01605 [archaeon]|nr:hypothetical protein [archaeon]
MTILLFEGSLNDLERLTRHSYLPIRDKDDNPVKIITPPTGNLKGYNLYPVSIDESREALKKAANLAGVNNLVHVTYVPSFYCDNQFNKLEPAGICAWGYAVLLIDYS